MAQKGFLRRPSLVAAVRSPGSRPGFGQEPAPCSPPSAACSVLPCGSLRFRALAAAAKPAAPVFLPPPCASKISDRDDREGGRSNSVGIVSRLRSRAREQAALAAAPNSCSFSAKYFETPGRRRSRGCALLACRYAEILQEGARAAYTASKRIRHSSDDL